MEYSPAPIHILHLETAEDVCSVAISANGSTLLSLSETGHNLHASHLTLLIDSLIREVNISYAELHSLSISAGPGSYTGLRIGTATAKGICYALDIPLIAIETLDALAKTAMGKISIPTEEILCPMLDARRMEVYSKLINGSGKIISATEAKILDAHFYEEYLTKQQICFFGSGMEKAREMLGTYPNASFLDDITTDAAAQSALAYRKFINAEFENIASYDPFYLKEARITTPKPKI